MDGDARERLLAWYDARKRDLPWRHARDPYAIWVSEVMLQQTRVETVLPYYKRWMSAFPDVRALAAADEETVLQHWQGLGYYSRARNLWRAARVVVAEGGGQVPASYDALRSLPGVGDYTAGAIASIAFGEPVPAVDGNVVRVTARVAGIGEEVSSQRVRRRIRELAASWVDPQRPGDWNQALMELGATVCTPRAPKCSACPVAASCQVLAAGDPEAFPKKAGKRPPKPVAMHFAAVAPAGRILLVQNPDEGLLAGLWGLPGGPTDVPLEDHVRQQTGVLVRPAEAGSEAHHVFTHRVWQMRVHAASVLDVDHAAPGRPTRWQPLERLSEVPLSTAARKAIAAAGIPVPERHAEPGRPVSPADSAALPVGASTR